MTARPMILMLPTLLRLIMEVLSMSPEVPSGSNSGYDDATIKYDSAEHNNRFADLI